MDRAIVIALLSSIACSVQSVEADAWVTAFDGGTADESAGDDEVGFDDGATDPCEIDDEGCPCTPGETKACYPSAAPHAGIGACALGTRRCTNAHELFIWGPCEGAAMPSSEVCGDGIDNDCDGVDDVCEPTDPACDAGDPGCGDDLDDCQEEWRSPVSAASACETAWAGKSFTGSASFAVDGDPSTVWTCDAGFPATLEADLGSVVSIGKIRASWGGHVTGSNAVDVVLDGVPILSAAHFPGEHVLVPPVAGQHLTWRSITAPPAGGSWSELGELEVLVTTCFAR